MPVNPNGPLVVQGDMKVLLEATHHRYEEARDRLGLFCNLLKCPEYFHEYEISPLTIWNAAAAGIELDFILGTLHEFSRYDVPANVLQQIERDYRKYGKIILEKDVDSLVLRTDNPRIFDEIRPLKEVRPYLLDPQEKTELHIKNEDRGNIKRVLTKVGYPIRDLVGYIDGDPLAITIREQSRSGKPFSLRDYQKDSVRAFLTNNPIEGGSGVVVLPCGAGKTVVGIATMAKLQMHTLILATNITALRQWREEILDKTNLEPEQIGEYSGERRQFAPVTIATYQIVIYRPDKNGPFPHFRLFDERNWGLIIYDEVHLLPAPVFQKTADIQARKRLGLTATLIREDNREAEVFSLIGPLRYSRPWRLLENQGWLARANCLEYRIPMPEGQWEDYLMNDERHRIRVAAENRYKIRLLEQILERHENDLVLIIGQYINQLEEISNKLGAELITGKTPEKRREELYSMFRKGEIRRLVVSKVANFAVDLPDANVAIQVSGTFGSRQEEAQRLGRILRPKDGENLAHFYSLVTADTEEEKFAEKRHLYLVEQGYEYDVQYLETANLPSDN